MNSSRAAPGATILCAEEFILLKFQRGRHSSPASGRVSDTHAHSHTDAHKHQGPSGLAGERGSVVLKKGIRPAAAAACPRASCRELITQRGNIDTNTSFIYFIIVLRSNQECLRCVFFLFILFYFILFLNVSYAVWRFTKKTCFCFLKSD